MALYLYRNIKDNYMNICMISLGCDKNLVDSEMMLGFTAKHGYTYTDDTNAADIIIVNTCCFILDAKEESIDAILEMSKLKKDGNLKCLIVTGCMAQRYKNEIIDEIPEVDAVVGTASYDHICDIIEEALSGKKEFVFEELSRLPAASPKRMVSTGGWYAYLKIAEGCDKHCTYCIIPSLRGRYRSYPEDILLKQARELSDAGVKELILVAQETTVYGKDIDGKKHLPTLLKKLCAIEGIEWIRILYCYPEEITDELIDTIASEDKICNYLDIPVQSGSDYILKKMGRLTNVAELTENISKLREKIPDIILRTTLISGFPGESNEHFNETLDFVKRMKFERLGVFPYSAEEGTVAATLVEQVDEEVKQDRRDAIMSLQQGISSDFLKKHVGKTLRVLIEGKIADEDAYIGRSYMDAPGVDGCIFVQYSGELLSGDFVDVKITGSSEYDLIGELI